MNDMHEVWSHDTRLGLVLPKLQEPEPADQWLKEALKETQAHEEAGFTFQETSWGYKLKRRQEK